MSFDVDRFQINGKLEKMSGVLCRWSFYRKTVMMQSFIILVGKGLRLLTKADIELRAPSAGDVIHNAIQFIMSTYSSQAARTPPYLKGGR